MENETLSDKIIDTNYEDFGREALDFIEGDFIHVKNVREFISKLKEELKGFGYPDGKPIFKIINKLAGKELSCSESGTLANHSPQKLIMNTRRWAGKKQHYKMLDKMLEDTQKGCGKEGCGKEYNGVIWFCSKACEEKK